MLMNEGQTEKYELASEELRKDEKKLSVSLLYPSSLCSLEYYQETGEGALRSLPPAAELGRRPPDRAKDEE